MHCRRAEQDALRAPTDFPPITIALKSNTHEELPFWKHVSPHFPVAQLARHQRSPPPPLAVWPVAEAQLTQKEENKG